MARRSCGSRNGYNTEFCQHLMARLSSTFVSETLLALVTSTGSSFRTD